MTTQSYPLLVQGIFSDQNATNGTLNPAAPLTNGGWTNKIQTGRGNLVLIDFVPTNIDNSTNPVSQVGVFSYQVGGQTVVQNMESRSFAPGAYPRSNEILALNQPGGQSVRLLLDTLGGTSGLVVHHYFENKFNTLEVMNARRSAALKQRIQEFRHTFATGLKQGQSAVFNVPIGIGNIVALEFIVNTAIVASKDWTLATFSMSVDGVTILDNANSSIFLPMSGRPGLVFPIVIRPGSTFQLFADTSELGVGDSFVFTARAYFDDDTNGNKQYILQC